MIGLFLRNLIVLEIKGKKQTKKTTTKNPFTWQTLDSSIGGKLGRATKSHMRNPSQEKV